MTLCAVLTPTSVDVSFVQYGVIGKSAVDNTRFMMEFAPVLAEVLV